MHPHSLTYLELNPEGAQAPREPSPLAIVCGACVALAGLWLTCAFFLSL